MPVPGCPPPWSWRVTAGASPPLVSTPRGKAVQVDPIKPTLKPPGTKRLKLKCDVLLSTFAFKFNLRRYTGAAMHCLCGPHHAAVGPTHDVVSGSGVVSRGLHSFTFQLNLSRF